MKASLIYRHRVDFDDGAVLEAVVWKLDTPVPGCTHKYKYRLFYGRNKREIGYDNERSKGDHHHLGAKETLYRFVSPEKLIDDFMAEVSAKRAAK